METKEKRAMDGFATARKPHADWAGYRCELRNKYSGGHTVVVDCKLAEQQGAPWVENYKEECGRYMVVCDSHSTTVHCTALPDARGCMKDPTSFCDECRKIEAKLITP